MQEDKFTVLGARKTKQNKVKGSPGQVTLNGPQLAGLQVCANIPIQEVMAQQGMEHRYPDYKSLDTSSFAMHAVIQVVGHP